MVVHRGSRWSVSSKGSMDQAPQGWSLDRESMFRIHVFKCRTPGGYSWELLVGVCRPVLQILILFQTEKCYFSHPFSDQTSTIHTRFQIWPSGRNRNYVIILRLGRKQKNSSNPFGIRIFLFLSYVYSFGIDTINTFMHPRSSFENHT